jgi:hypothetical protein
MPKEILPLLQSYLDSYGQRYKLHLGPNPIVVLTKAQDVEVSYIPQKWLYCNDNEHLPNNEEFRVI